MAAATLLLANLPSTSGAFSKFVPVASENDHNGMSSPPRKAARLDQSGSSASAITTTKGKERAGGQQRRIRVNLVSTPPDLKAEVTSLLPRLVRSVRAILSLPAPHSAATKPGEPSISLPESFEATYQACHVLVVLAHKGQDVYDAVTLEVERAVSAVIKSVSGARIPGVAWLDKFTSAMEWLDGRIGLLRSILADLDTGFASRDPSRLTFRDLCLDIIRKNVYQHGQSISLITEGIREWAKQERANDGASSGATTEQDVDMERTDHRALILRFISVLHIVGYFQSHFLDPYISYTTEFYTAEAKRLGKSLSPADYLAYVDRRLNEEHARAKDIMDEPSRKDVLNAAEHTLLPTEITSSLANPGFAVAWKERKIGEIARMYALYRRVGALDGLRAAFRDELQTCVRDVVTDSSKDDEMVSRLLEEKLLLDRVLIEALHERPFGNTVQDIAKLEEDPESDGQRLFAYSARDAFEKGFLARKRKPAEMIAKYVDQAMRKGQRDEDEGTFWHELDNVLGLYRFTQDKDVFRTFYERGLAKRLLLQKSASDALEERVINRLRDGYDPEFGKGNDMFKDIALSRDLLAEYRASMRNKNERFSAMVLKFSTWPFGKYEGTIGLPPDMSEEIASFEEFYKLKHKNHKLEWNHSLGTVTLSAQFDSGSKELSVSLYQAVVLLLFQNESKLSYKDILSQSGLKPKDTILTLQSLALGKARVLVKRPTGKDIGDDDEFLFNVKFEDKRRKIHIPSIQQQETVEETKQIEQAIDLDRQATVDAAIVRIMKGSKKLADEQLKIKTIEALRRHFVPTVQDIKKRIEHLLEREYMERDEKDHNLYHYVA
ncbi:hypothetical protein FRC05_004703 [Tulasnella sp. 425]|nr:hypothetical protein FRC05_004703 [Tulasnella sp. 425]